MLSNNPKISVIIPAYNIAEYLPRCLDSVLGQTYKNLEVIVVSDGSTDGTNDVIKEYADKDKRIVPVFKTNSGVSDTRNKGLDIASGDYLGFVDGDDFIELNMYEVLMNNALKYDADISHCGYQMVFPSRVDYYYNTGELRVQDNKQGLRDLIIADKIEPGVWNKLYKRSIVEEVRFNKDVRELEDLLYNVFAFKKAKISVYEDIALYNYILRKGSATTGEIKKHHIEGRLFVWKEILNIVSDNDLKDIIIQKWLDINIRLYRSVNLSKSKELKREYNIKLKKHLREMVYQKSKIGKRIAFERFCILYMPYVYVLLSKLHSYIKGNKYEIK